MNDSDKKANYGWAFIAGLVVAFVGVTILFATGPQAHDGCAAAFGLKPADVTYHDGMCWKKNAETPLGPIATEKQP